MKQFKEKLIARLEEQAEEHKKYWQEFDDEDSFGGMNATLKAIEIVNELAEEYSKDIDWKTTRRYLDEKYFSKIRELSTKYNHPCEDIPINFDWVFELIEKIEVQLAEEMVVAKNAITTWIPCSGCEDCQHKECEHNGKV